MDSGKSSSEQATAARPRSVIWHALLFAVVAAFVVGTAYYALAHAKTSAFNDERAFRVLGDVGEQINNLQSSRAAVLGFLPPHLEAAIRSCSGGAPLTSELQQQLNLYLARLDLFEPVLCKSDVADTTSPIAVVCNQASANDQSVLFRLHYRDRQFRLTAVRCGGKVRFSLQEAFEKLTAYFVAQNLFDEALLALPQGTVFGEFVRKDNTTDGAIVDFHPSMAEKLSILDASQLLEQARIAQTRGAAPVADEKEKPQGKPAAATLGRPVAFNAEIGGVEYRAYVLPFRSPYPIVTDPQLGIQDNAARDGLLYLIGLQRTDVGQAIVHTLWPYGAWIITLALALCMLGWPLVSLAFEPAEEAISPRKAVVCVFAAVLLTALLTVAAGSLWSQRTLQSWMSQSAQRYAAQLKDAIETDINDAVAVLASDRNQYHKLDAVYGIRTPCVDGQPTPAQNPNGSVNPVFFQRAPGSSEECAAERSNSWMFEIAYADGEPRCPILGAPATPLSPTDVCTTLRLSSVDGPITWSPFRNIIALDEEGSRIGPSLTVFRDVGSKRGVNLADRPYFRALRTGQTWVSSAQQTRGERFVAQRLFNRSDASRTLQIAVPLCASSQSQEYQPFCGVITGDVRLHGLIASISPPLLEFAVIDYASGTVLFHSDDRRSLTENFFREVENEPALQAAIRARQPSAFSGAYLGESHGFYYQPLRDIPWGVVVFYSMKKLGDVPFHAGASALTAYAGAFVACTLLLMLGIAAWYAFKARTGVFRGIAERICPVFPLSQEYLRLGRLHASIWAVLALVLVLLMDPGSFRFVTPDFAGLRIPAFVIIPLLVLLAVLCIDWFRPYTPPDAASLRAWQLNAYVERAAVLLVVFAILPALWLVLHFHDLQLKGLLRDSLIQGSYQMQDRQRLIRHDFQRWLPPDGQELDPYTGKPRYPSAHAMAQIGIPGFRTREVALFDSVPWSGIGAPRGPGSFAARIWETTVGSVAQLRRLGLAAGQTSSQVDCASRDSSEQCAMSAENGGIVRLSAPAQASNFLLAGDTYGKTLNLFTVVASLLLSLLAGHCLAQFLVRQLLGLSRSFAPTSSSQDEPFDEQRFDAVWNELSPVQRVTLYQIARGDLPNPRNEAVLKKLCDKGLLGFEHWLCLRKGKAHPAGLKLRILDAISPEDHARHRSEAPRNTWKSIRTPLFVVLMILIAWLSWAAGGSMKALSAVLVGTVAFLGQLSQLLNFARGNAGAPKS